MRGPEAAAPHAVVTDETERISILDEGIFAGDSFVDRDEHFFFP
jgi:hypothetical protein